MPNRMTAEMSTLDDDALQIDKNLQQSTLPKTFNFTQTISLTPHDIIGVYYQLASETCDNIGMTRCHPFWQQITDVNLLDRPTSGVVIMMGCHH